MRGADGLGYALVCHLDDKAAPDNLRLIRSVDDKRPWPTPRARAQNGGPQLPLQGLHAGSPSDFWPPGGYRVGSLSFAQDHQPGVPDGSVRSAAAGAGNPGATNLIVPGNKAAAILTLLSDALKGMCRFAVTLIGARPWGLQRRPTAALVGLRW